MLSKIFRTSSGGKTYINQIYSTNTISFIYIHMFIYKKKMSAGSKNINRERRCSSGVQAKRAKHLACCSADSDTETA